MRLTYRVLLAASLLALMFASCGDNDTGTTPEPAPVETVASTEAAPRPQRLERVPFDANQFHTVGCVAPGNRYRNVWSSNTEVLLSLSCTKVETGYAITAGWTQFDRAAIAGGEDPKRTVRMKTTGGRFPSTGARKGRCLDNAYDSSSDWQGQTAICIGGSTGTYKVEAWVSSGGVSSRPGNDRVATIEFEVVARSGS